MSGGYLYGWDAIGEDWVKVVCNPDGELDIDATAIFENPPTEDEAAKGPSSEWAFDHDADVAAHHARYTDVESRASIGGVLNASGKLTETFNVNNFGLANIKFLALNDYYGGGGQSNILLNVGNTSVNFWFKDAENEYQDFSWEMYDGSNYQSVIRDDTFQSALALYLEEAPTNGVVNKAPTSNWAFDHDADAAAHHAKYTDTESRAAIDDIFGSDGKLTKALNVDFNILNNINELQLKYASGSTYKAFISCKTDGPELRIIIDEIGVGHKDAVIKLNKTDHYVNVIDEESYQANLALYLEENPSNGVVNKAPTSNWAFDHNANTAAHHSKYTNAEAVAACGLDGNLYHSISAVAFKPSAPHSVQHAYLISGSLRIYDNTINVYCPVELPDGVTVTLVKVDGNAGASSKTWTMYRVALSDQTKVVMASATVQSEDTSISYDVIEHRLYVYFITVTSLMANDEIYSGRIRYAL